ncbi:MAG: hypothetical protein D6760_02405 [Deltaproteobacteria bacterium]|nr:MAG: hypothetical protein D6760_02405 [Deltaproteobacteria bacterium]
MSDTAAPTSETIADLCRQNAEAIAQSLGACLGGSFRMELADIRPWSADDAPAQLRGAGLAIAMATTGPGVLVLVPESLPLPDWYSTPDSGQAERLESLALEWSMLILAEGNEATDLATFAAQDLYSEVLDAQPLPEAQLLTLKVLPAEEHSASAEQTAPASDEASSGDGSADQTQAGDAAEEEAAAETPSGQDATEDAGNDEDEATPAQSAADAESPSDDEQASDSASDSDPESDSPPESEAADTTGGEADTAQDATSRDAETAESESVDHAPTGDDPTQAEPASSDGGDSASSGTSGSDGDREPVSTSAVYIVWPVARLPIGAEAESGGASTGGGAHPGGSLSREQLARLLQLPVTVVVQLASKKIQLENLLSLTPGSLITFEKSCEELLDLYVNNRLYARGEAVKIGEKFGLKIDEVGAEEIREERIIEG